MLKQELPWVHLWHGQIILKHSGRITFTLVPISLIIFEMSIEKGVYDGEKLVKSGVGGISVYINGAIGGLMTTRASMPLDDPFLDTTYTEASFDKAKAQGARLAMLALKALENPDTSGSTANISLRAKTIKLPLDNNMFRMAAMLGISGFWHDWMVQNANGMAAFTVGPASFLCVPGEIYPEISEWGC